MPCMLLVVVFVVVFVAAVEVLLAIGHILRKASLLLELAVQQTPLLPWQDDPHVRSHIRH